MTQPNFFIIGAAKCGTTSCYAYLRQHPDIYMSPVKEPHYFSHTSDYADIPPGKIKITHYDTITDRMAYNALFQGASDCKIVGEASTSYLYIPETAERLHRFNPEAKLMVLLRNPAERAFSHYWHSVRHHLETRSLETALDIRCPEKNDMYCNYLARGIYYPQLKRYFERFPSSQIRIMVFERFTNNARSHLTEACQWLGIDSAHAFDTYKAWNENLIPANPSTPTVKKAFLALPSWGRKIIPRPMKDMVKNRIYKPRPTLPPELRSGMLDFYRDDILKTQDLIGQDLSLWLK